MDDLIEALMIFKKYKNNKYPTTCSYDILSICDIEPKDVSNEDTKRLDELGFFVSKEKDDGFISFRFGSC